jgi:hypothetical protein
MRKIPRNKVLRSFIAVFCVLVLSGTLIFFQSCGSSGTTPEITDDTSGDINYRDKAYTLVDQIYAAGSPEAIEPLLKEAFTIIGVPVYNHANTAIIPGSGSLTQGMALRDYQVFILASTMFNYIQNPARHTTPKAFSDGVNTLAGDNAPVKINFAGGNAPVEFDPGMVAYMGMLYGQISTVWGTAREYFLADLFTALAEKAPKHEAAGSNFYLDPLQSFLMKLDWFSKPLNPATYIGFTYKDAVLPKMTGLFSADALPKTASATKDGMDSLKGYWSMAQYVAGAAVDALGTVLDVGGMVAGEIIADGTQISVECDSPMYYGSGQHSITISVTFNVDLNKYATDYGWTVGVDVPEVGPIKRAKVALDGWSDLAPRHGLFSGGQLSVLDGLSAGGAIASDSGEVTVNFTVNDQQPTDCPEENQDTVQLVAEVNPITDPTAWQSGIVNSIWPRTMPFWIDVRWKKSNADCSNGGGGYSK